MSGGRAIHAENCKVALRTPSPSPFFLGEAEVPRLQGASRNDLNAENDVKIPRGGVNAVETHVVAGMEPGSTRQVYATSISFGIRNRVTRRGAATVMGDEQVTPSMRRLKIVQQREG